MINVKTLSSLYPAKTLKILIPVQLVSLHMLLHRPYTNLDSGDPTFGPYISTLPRDFGGHPLTWMLANSSEYALHERLISSLPPAIHVALQEIYRRFWEDWRAVCEHLVSFLLLHSTMVLTFSQKKHPTIVAQSSRHDLRQSKFDTSNEQLQDHFLWAWLNRMFRIPQSYSPNSETSKSTLVASTTD